MKKVTQLCLLVLALSLSSILNSQNLKKDISQANIELLKELQIQEQERIERVESYFANNPQAKRSLSNGSKIIHVHDIIDGKPIYITNDNLDATRATKTTHLQPGGSLNLNLDGTGETVGVWDSGPAQDTHTEFLDATQTVTRVTIVENSFVSGEEEASGFSSHGTHVAGTVGARGAAQSAKGMAPNVNIKSYNWSNDSAEMIQAANDAVSPVLVSNHSYGVYVENVDPWFMGAYTQKSQNWDNIARNNPIYTIVTSAGNSGTTTYTGGMFAGYDKLTSSATSKNVLVIANASPTLTPFTYEVENLAINPSSSQGPTDDLRIKPDLAGDGTGLYSPVPVDGYDTYTGTSMASPNVAGSLILLQQYYNQLHGSYMNSSTLRALVCHTALDDINVVGPDPKFGWGLLNAKASAETILDDLNNLAEINELSLLNGDTYTYTFSAQAGDKLMATICWTDLPGVVTTNGDLNNPTPKLVNDLDLRLTMGANTYLPWKLNYSASTGFSNSKADNAVDNIERVEIEAPLTGTYTLTVTNKGTLQGNVGGPFDPQSQDFSLILTGNNLTLGVEEYNLNDIVVWPNPAKETLNINLKNVEQKSNVVLYDLKGRIVMETFIDSSNSNGTLTLDLSDFSKGIYMLKVFNSSTTFNKKIIIK